MIQIATVCGMGLGTSMMLALQIRAALAEAGVAANVQPVDLGSVRTAGAQIVVGSSELRSQLSTSDARVVLIDNLIDRSEVRTKVLAAIEDSRE